MIAIFFQKTPLLRFLVPFIIGIILGALMEMPLWCLMVVMVFWCLLFFACVIGFRMRASYRWRFLPGVAFVSWVIAFGMFYIQLRKPIVLDSKLQSDIAVKVISGLGETPRSLKYDVELIGGEDSVVSRFIGSDGRLYLKRDGLDQIPQPGEIWIVSGQVMPYQSPGTPYMFDYSDYLRKNRIAFQFICNTGTCNYSKDSESFDLFVFCAQLKGQLMHLFSEYGMSQRERAVLNALFLGDKSELSSDQKDHFAAAGAMHLLAVSGLHVGIIYLLAGFLLNACGLRRKRSIKVVFIVLILLGYAILTGLSPSVLRAFIMFSMMEIGILMKRRKNIFNMIFASLLLILLLDPLAIYNIGFWLSHVAVISIIVFYPLINGWFVFKFPPFKWIWSLFSVSIAAQIGTFPLGIAIFHDFPIYFIISNLLLIPIVAPILVLAILSVGVQFSSFLSKMFIGCLSNLLEYLNDSVQWIESLPYSVWSHLYLGWHQVALIYLALLLFLMFRESVQIRYIRYLVMVVLFIGLSFLYGQNARPNQVLVATHSSGRTLVNIFDRNHNVVFVDRNISNRNVSYCLKGIWSFYGAPVDFEIISGDSSIRSPVVLKQMEGLSILYVRKEVQWPSNEGYPFFDWIIFNQVPNQSLEELSLKVNFDKVILGGGGSRIDKEKWLQANRKYRERICLLEEQGAQIFSENYSWYKLNPILFGNMGRLSLNLR